MGSIQLFYVAALEILKLHYELHTSNPMTYHPIKMAIARLWKCYYTALHDMRHSIGRS